MAKPRATADLHVVSDLNNQRDVPVRTAFAALQDVAGKRIKEVPAKVIKAAKSPTVPASTKAKRATVGAANPLAIATVAAKRKAKVTPEAAIRLVEEHFGETVESLLDPAKNLAIYPGLELAPDGSVRNVIREGQSGSGQQWGDYGHFFTDAAQFTDPVQGDLADCYFIAALASVAWAGPLLIQERTRSTDNAGAFADPGAVDVITFFDGNGSHQIEANELLPKQGGNWIHARADDPSELWPAVYEKAFAMWKTNSTSQQPNYPAINYGDTVAAATALTGGEGSYYPTTNVITLWPGLTFDLVTAEQIWQTVRANSLSCRTVVPMMAWTYGSSSDSPYTIDYGSAGIVANHAYSILGWDYQNGTEYIILRNPWGWKEATVDVESGSWSAYDISYWRNTPLSSGGVFGLRAETFKEYFEGFGKATFPSGVETV